MGILRFLNPFYLIEFAVVQITAAMWAAVLFLMSVVFYMCCLVLVCFSVLALLNPDVSFVDLIRQFIPRPEVDEVTRNPSKDAIQIIEEKKLRMIAKLNKPLYPPEIQIAVERDRIVQDSFNSIMPWIGKSRLHHAIIEVRFVGEEGIDAGGLTREWLVELSKKMADPEFGLFRVSDVDNSTLIISSLPGVKQSMLPNFISRVFSPHQMRLQYFQFFGLIVGKTIYEGLLMDCHFSMPFYKQLLNIQVDFADLQAEDPVFFKNLMGMMDYSIDDAGLDLTFSVSEEENTEKPTVIDLKPNGRNIAVNDSNKFEYITLLTEYRLIGRVQLQMNAFKTGLHEIIPIDVLQIFNENELELLICGLPDIDLKDWKQNSEYIDKPVVESPNDQTYSASTYTIPDSRIRRYSEATISTAIHFLQSVQGVKNDRTLATLVRWYWRCVESFTREQRGNLLQFITGTSKVPLGGFANLKSGNQIKKFSILIDRRLKDSHLPTSRTCFNQLILPSYTSYDVMRKKLLAAITESSIGFGTT